MNSITDTFYDLDLGFENFENDELDQELELARKAKAEKNLNLLMSRINNQKHLSSEEQLAHGQSIVASQQLIISRMLEVPEAVKLLEHFYEQIGTNTKLRNDIIPRGTIRATIVCPKNEESEKNRLDIPKLKQRCLAISTLCELYHEALVNTMNTGSTLPNKALNLIKTQLEFELNGAYLKDNYWNALRSKLSNHASYAPHKDVIDDAVRNIVSRRRTLVKTSFALVFWTVRPMATETVDIFELFQEGIKGLKTAAFRWYPENGAFATTATNWIKSKARKYKDENSDLIRMPHKLHEIKCKLAKLQHDALLITGAYLTPEEAAKALDVQVHHVKNIYRIMAAPIRLNSHIGGDDEGAEYIDFLQSGELPPEERHDIKETQKGVHQALAKVLTPKENAVIKLRFGFAGKEMTLEEIGDKFYLSRERIRQIEAQALFKLKRHARSNQSFRDAVIEFLPK